MRSIVYILLGAAALWSCGDDPGEPAPPTVEAVNVGIVGEGQVEYVDSFDTLVCSDHCGYSVDEGVSFTLKAVGTGFDRWECYGPTRVTYSGQAALNLTGDPTRDLRCIAMFGTVHELGFTIEHDPAELLGLAEFEPGTPRDAVCVDDGVPRFGGCACGASCDVFVKSGTNFKISSATPGVGLEILAGSDCPAPNFVVDSQTLSTDPASCQLRLSQPRLIVEITGNGRVTSNPPGIDCQGAGPGDPDIGACSNAFALGAPLSLSAEPNVGAQFVEWLGPCSPSGQVSVVDVTTPTMCTASFSGGVVVGQAGVVELVTLETGGGNLSWVSGRADARNTVDISTDGHQVAFLATTPLAYRVRDVVGNATTTVGPTVAQTGAQNLSVSGDGRFVAFTSDDATLSGMFGLPAPVSGFRVYVRDVETGTLNLVSGNDLANGIEVRDQVGSHATISDNGRWVAFAGRLVRTSSTGLRTPEGNFRVLLRDTCAGVPNCMPRTMVGSALTNGMWSMSTDFSNTVDPTLSADGRYLAYRSNSLFLGEDGGTPGDPTSPTETYGRYHIFLRDRDADGNGEFDQAGGVTQKVISIDSLPNGDPLTGSFIGRPVISADGGHVVYTETAFDLLNAVFSPILRYDSCTAQPVTWTCTTAIRGSGDDGFDRSNTEPDISADGRYVSMNGSVPGGSYTVLVRDTCLHTNVLCDSQARSPAVNPNNGNPVGALNPRISGDGTAVVFTTTSSLMASDGSSDQDVYLAQTGFGPAPALPGLQPLIDGVALEGVPVDQVGDTLPAGADELLITVGGDNFLPGARVVFDGAVVGTIYAGRNKLQFRATPGAPRVVRLTVQSGGRSANASVVIQQ